MPTTAAIHAMLAPHRGNLTHLAAHTAYSESGANEVSGGSYARVASAWNVESGKAFTQSGTRTINGIATGTVVRFIGGWNALSAGTFQDMWPLGGALMKFATDLAANTLQIDGHTYTAGTEVVLMWGTAPGGLTKGTSYYVISPTATSIQLAATPGGSAIDLTSLGDTECKISKIVPWTSDGGPLNITSATVYGNG